MTLFLTLMALIMALIIWKVGCYQIRNRTRILHRILHLEMNSRIAEVDLL